MNYDLPEKLLKDITDDQAILEEEYTMACDDLSRAMVNKEKKEKELENLKLAKRELISVINSLKTKERKKNG